MSDIPQGDAVKAAAEAAVAAATKNLKEEFTRKNANTEAKLEALLKVNEELKRAVTSQPTQQASKGEDLSDLIYSNPERYTQIIEERATKTAESRIESKLNTQAKASNTIAALQAEFPELASNDHELTKKAVEIYSALPDEEKSSPLAYKVAVKEAAMELGIKPRSKRSEEEMLLSSGGSGGATRRDRKPKLDSRTVEFAKIMGINMDDAKTKERIEQRLNRNWNKYE